ncbi:ABC transporter substrate-binding protein [Chitiniphilus purpureus]|uniref:Probable sugar-binding periplasmic protein n=1 Tax=Chitiniphilus purpureus TaxID=2981137 RepID=A0ABY6DPN7_9NEIS|nr:ABC transporter substrate-binding protein [Chitiniphilus sp. CD1]UXY16324.1 ABC transporter substrate-binding protein [Chitiniphilus sp. CD1]
MNRIERRRQGRARLGIQRHVLAWLLWCLAPWAGAAQTLDVLHWWTSASERQAADMLAQGLATEHVIWRDAAIPGGAGVGAFKVLKSRVLSGRAPNVAQLIGPTIGDWAGLGLLLELDDVARDEDWRGRFFPTIWSLTQVQQHVVAVPIGLHRINTLYYQREVLAGLGLLPPRNWAEFERVAVQLQRAGVTPLAQSSEPWQVATLFETLLLASVGPAQYRQLFTLQRPDDWYDPRVRQALERLRSLKRWMPQPVPQRSWDEVARGFARGEAAMWIMGDWAKGELMSFGLEVDRHFSCAAAPGTMGMHLYSVDTFAMLAGDYGKVRQQEAFARIAASPAMQLAYNRIKGSVPVRRDIDPAQLDSCARQSWQTFARGEAVQAPSIVHRMATDEAMKDAIIAQVYRYFTDDQVTAGEVQRRLAAISRALK